ncbi:ornithine cyclodeaminase family protein [Haloarchaeobius sp. DFWS5]|uniref:ornithine cyclodeaminase family protein n=1 Tax=Haloarchaeobius sp. DFWS5 TaxID=3446114 RepID=UPI003EBDD26E
MDLLTDDDVVTRIDVVDTVATIELALREHANGTLHAPPRWSIDVADGGLRFTCGAATGDLSALGFRVYDTFATDSPEHTQLVCVFDADTGAFRGLISGYEVGVMRTAGIDGVAIDRFARDDASTLGVLGAGTQAKAHAEAAAAVRNIDTVRVYSPTPASREAFADEVGPNVDATIEVCDGPESVVRGADVLVCATNSEEPVFDADCLDAGTHVTTVGRKFEDAHELPLAVVDRADAIVTDSRAQVEAYHETVAPFFLDDDQRARMRELGAVVVGDEPGRTGDDELTLFCSVGLAGTEVVLADEILRRE